MFCLVFRDFGWVLWASNVEHTETECTILGMAQQTKVMRKFRKFYGKKNEMKHWADFVDFMRGSDSRKQPKKILRKKKQKPSKVRGHLL